MRPLISIGPPAAWMGGELALTPIVRNGGIRRRVGLPGMLHWPQPIHLIPGMGQGGGRNSQVLWFPDPCLPREDTRNSGDQNSKSMRSFRRQTQSGIAAPTGVKRHAVSRPESALPAGRLLIVAGQTAPLRRDPHTMHPGNTPPRSGECRPAPFGFGHALTSKSQGDPDQNNPSNLRITTTMTTAPTI
jgi:hypothetical protein